MRFITVIIWHWNTLTAMAWQVFCVFSREQWHGTCLSQTCKNYHLNRHLYTPVHIFVQRQFVVCTYYVCSDLFIEVMPYPHCGLITELWHFPVNNSTVPLYTSLCIEITLRHKWQNSCLTVELRLMKTWLGLSGATSEQKAPINCSHHFKLGKCLRIIRTVNVRFVYACSNLNWTV